MTAATKDRAPLVTIDRRDGEQIHVAWSEYNGVDFLDVRVFYRDASGDWRPTKKGITVRAGDQLDALIAGLQEAKATAPGGRS